MSYFIQIGAGAGDQDERSNYKDGFTNFIKKNIRNRNNKVLIIEANPLNLDKLKLCWRDFPNSKIYNIAIVEDSFSEKYVKLFYTKEDGPCYQVTSINKEHVKKHYPNCEILEINVISKKINDFLFQEVGLEKIEYLSLDVEGIDFNLIMDLDLKRFNIKNISIEFIHFTKNQNMMVFKKLIENGYSYSGQGFDINGYDLMFKKKMNIYLKLKTKFKLFKILKKLT